MLCGDKEVVKPTAGSLTATCAIKGTPQTMAYRIDCEAVTLKVPPAVAYRIDCEAATLKVPQAVAYRIDCEAATQKAWTS